MNERTGKIRPLNRRTRLLRRLIIVILSIIVPCTGLTFLLTACATESRPASTGETSVLSPSPVKITFWNVLTNDRRHEILSASIRQFNQSRSDIQIVPYFYETESYKNKLKVAMFSGKMPDLFYYWTGESFKYMVDSQIVADLTEFVENHKDFSIRFRPETLVSSQYYGRIYGVAHSIHHVLIWYNKRLFAEHGLTPPETWDQFLNIVDILKSKGITPIAVSGKERWPLLHWYAYLAHRLGGSSPFDRALKGAGDFTDPSFIRAARLFRELVNKKPFIEGFLGLDLPTAEKAFLSGEAAMYLQGDWGAEKLLRNGEIGYFRFPTVHGFGEAREYYGGFAVGWAIAERSNKEAAFRVLDYMLSEPERTRFVEGTGTLSTLKEIRLSKENMDPEVYEYAQFISRDPVGYFGFYDQQLEPRRAQLLLDAIVKLAGEEQMDPRRIEELMGTVR